MPSPSPLAEKPGVTAIELPQRAMQLMSEKFPQGVNVLVCAPAALQPEFIRLPKAGEKCPVTGLPRTTLLELLQEAGPKRIPVRYLRKKGSTTGISLIPRRELVDYINELPAPEWQPENEAARALSKKS